MRAKYLVVLDKQEEITKTISEITLKVDSLKTLRNYYDVYLVATYKFAADGLRLRKLTSNLRFVFPCFTPGKINTQHLNEQFGSVSELFINTEKSQIPIESPIYVIKSFSLRRLSRSIGSNKDLYMQWRIPLNDQLKGNSCDFSSLI